MRLDSMKSLPTFTHFKLLFLTALVFTSCSRAETLFKVPATINMTIPAGINIFDIFGLRTQETFLYEASLSSRGIDPGAVDRVTACSGFFRSFFNAVELEFISVIEISVVDPQDTTRTREVFFVDPVPLGSRNELQLNPSLPEIQDFIYEGDKLMFLVELTFRSIPPSNLDIRIDMEFSALAEE